MGAVINNQEVVHLYDVPHIFKGIRNNLLDKDLHFTVNGVNKIASWQHILQFFFLDTADDTRICPKLTDRHVIKGKINKLKVSYATQVFSHQVGALMMRISKWGMQSNEHSIDAAASDTAELLLFMDTLFDSLNGHKVKSESSKPLKGGVREDTGHQQYWSETINILKTVKFMDPRRKVFVQIPSVKNLIHTLKGMIYLCNVLFANKFKYVIPRTINQDALENFFGCIRSHGIRNVTPNVSHFTSSFKALVINNYIAGHSPGRNCEKDFNDGALNNLKSLLTGKANVTCTALEEDVAINAEEFEHQMKLLEGKRNRVANCTIYYVAGYVGNKALKYVKNCVNCKKSLLNVNSPHIHQLSDFVEASYKTCRLIQPGSFLHFIVKEAIGRLFYLLPRLCHSNNLSKVLLDKLLRHLNALPLNCVEHNNLHLYILKLIIRCIIFFWVKQVNLISKGRSSKFEKVYNKNLAKKKLFRCC